jgi:hypothetical protein
MFKGMEVGVQSVLYQITSIVYLSRFTGPLGGFLEVFTRRIVSLLFEIITPCVWIV